MSHAHFTALPCCSVRQAVLDKLQSCPGDSLAEVVLDVGKPPLLKSRGSDSAGYLLDAPIVSAACLMPHW